MSQDRPVKKVLDDGEVDKTLLGVDIGDVCTPFFIWTSGLEILAHPIGVGMDPSISMLDLPIGVSFSSDRTNMKLSHHSQNTLMIDLETIFSLDPDLNSSITMGVPGLFIGFTHYLHTLLIRIWLIHSLPPSIIG